MRTRLRSITAVASFATVALLASACTSSPSPQAEASRPSPGWVGFVEQQREAAGEVDEDAAGEAAAEAGVEAGEHPMQKVGDSGGESAELYGRLSEFSQARLAPYGSVQAGAYTTAWNDLGAQPRNGSSWTEVTTTPYNADDDGYRDPAFSNSGGGSGYVAGRVTGLAVGKDAVYAGGADGGVFRSTDKGVHWQSISDSLPTLSTGDLKYDAGTDTLWLATGEANTGATSYVGTGVYALPDPLHASFTSANRVGGTELESRGINKIEFDGAGTVYAATTRGLWKHSTDLTDTRAWQNVLMPNPAADGNIETPYANMVNDVAIQPGTKGMRVVANAAWRNGASYNGFYLSTDGGATFTPTPINPNGAINPKDVGNTEFAYSADGTKLYAVIESPILLQTGRQSGNTVLNGVFVSNKGDVAGPWNRIADYRKLANSGSALKPAQAGKGYAPGVQAWYNNFIAVDPGNANHVILGLEEVYETFNGGSTWSTTGPYWNFGFPCWNPLKPTVSTDAGSSVIAGCPQTTHSDQHSVAIDTVANRLWVGNDGGVYSRPLNGGTVDSLGHATDWVSANKDLRTLQYYSVATGMQSEKQYSVSGGLQDNGGSLLLPGAQTMVSPFGGDGGAVVVDRKNGCRILDEYVDLTLWFTTNCGRTDGSFSAIKDVSVPDVASRFIAPVEQDSADGNWIAGGRSVWLNTKTWDSTGPSDWVPQINLLTSAPVPAGASAVTEALTTALASRGGAAYAAWCGNVDNKAANCNSAGFTRGIATNVGTGTWHQLDTTGLPNRYPSGVAMAPNDDHTVYVTFSGFNRRWIEGPGISTAVSGPDGHVFEGVLDKDGNVTGWTEVRGSVAGPGAVLPDIPADAIVSLPNGHLVVGTDLGVEVFDGTSWRVVGPTGGGTAFPAVTVMYLHVSDDGNLYVATHGRGIWRTPLAGL